MAGPAPWNSWTEMPAMDLDPADRADVEHAIRQLWATLPVGYSVEVWRTPGEPPRAVLSDGAERVKYEAKR